MGRSWKTGEKQSSGVRARLSTGQRSCAGDREVEQREGDVPEDGLEPDLQEQEDGLPDRVDLG